MKLLTAYALGSCIINVAICLLSGPRDFHAVDPLRNLLLPWAIGINFSTVVLIAFFSRIAGWRRGLVWVLTSDTAISAIPFAMIWCLGTSKGAVSQSFGFLYTAFIFSKCLVLVWYSLLNVSMTQLPAYIWVLVVTFLIYAGLTPWLAHSWYADGDEPHYLLLTHSLVVDRDFNLENNYRLGDYLPFYPIGLRPDDHHTLLNHHQEEVPVHDVGLSVLLVPGYAFEGRLGAMIELNLLGALAALGVFTLALQIGATQHGALFAWALFAFTSPLVVFSSQIFPEIVGATFSVWAMIGFVRIVQANRWSHLVLVGLLLGFLPWFSMRFWDISVPLFLIIALYILANREANGWRVVSKRLLSLFLPLMVSLTVFALFDLRYYNTIVPNAGYVFLTSQPERRSYWMFNEKGVLGLLFDRAYGLLPATPIYVIALAGAVVSLRRKSMQERWVIMTMLSVSALATILPAFNVWWSGGWSPPSRYLVSSVTLWAPLAALVVLDRKARVPVVILSAWSFFIAAAYTALPLTRYGLLVTTGALSQFIDKYTGFNYDVVFPSFIRAARVDYAMAAVWITVTAFLVWHLSRNSNESGARL